MFEIVLYQPEIPPNTGNIMRICANAGCRLHLVRPLWFSISDRQLERAADVVAAVARMVHRQDAAGIGALLFAQIGMFLLAQWSEYLRSWKDSAA